MRLVDFAFTSDQPESRFECKLDGRAFRRCASPFKSEVGPGRHAFSVRAVSAAGLADPTPVVFHWRALAS